MPVDMRRDTVRWLLKDMDARMMPARDRPQAYRHQVWKAF